MTDAELRALVRDAVAQRLGRDVPGGESTPVGPHDHDHPWRAHASHHLYLSLVNVDGACVIEPSVVCDHCGYCRSHGH